MVHTLDDYTALFNEHHHAEDSYFLPALRQAEPALDGVVDRLVAEHGQLARVSQLWLSRWAGADPMRTEAANTTALSNR